MASYMDTIIHLVNEETVVNTGVIFFSVSISSIFRMIYRIYDERANAVSNLHVHSIDENLLEMIENQPKQCLLYGAIKGSVGADGQSLRSYARSNVRGVANLRLTSEVKETSLTLSPTWKTDETVVASTLEQVPFHLHGKSKNHLVHIENATDSEWFNDLLVVVSEEFTPKDDYSMLEKFLNITNGERLRGYSDTEKMLEIGTSLIAIGEISLDEDGLKLRAPAKAIYDFILSRKSQGEVVSYLRHISLVWKVLTVLGCAATLCSSYYLFRKVRVRYLELLKKRRQSLDLEVIRRRRTDHQTPPPDCCNFQERACVVCLTNPRECVLLDCGHVCICADCVEQLPTPLKCPVCRENVDRILPIYHS